MKETLNNELIKAVKERLLEEVKLTDLFMDTLSIGKEAVYRRLRGDVPFTFYEAALIAKEMNLSLDKIAGNLVTEGAMFSYNLQHYKEAMTYFSVILNRYLDLFRYISSYPEGSLNMATNVIPLTYLFQYKTLTKFRLCRWLHQLQQVKPMGSMDKIQIPDKILSSIDKMGEYLLRIPETNIILDRAVFSTQAQSVRYFRDLNLISDEDVSEMKKELLSLLAFAEESAVNGGFKNGNKHYLFLSNINIETTYSYVEKTDFLLSMFHLYKIDYIYSGHPDINQMQKNWILSLRRYSTLISECGERERIEFFEQQRAVVSSL